MNYSLIRTNKITQNEKIMSVSDCPQKLFNSLDNKYKNSHRPNFDRLLKGIDCLWVNVGQGQKHDIFIKETNIKIV